MNTAEDNLDQTDVNEKHTYSDITAAQAIRLIDEGAVRILDVRNPDEFETLGHIPGAILLPMNLLAVAVTTLGNDDRPILVYCEHGIRSVAASEFLAQSGFSGIMNLVGGMAAWSGPRTFGSGAPFGPHGPSSWVVTNADLLPQGGTVLDVACGQGRHAILFASAGFEVLGVDHDDSKVAALHTAAQRAGIALRTEVLDLEQERVDLGNEAYDVIVVVHYLHRPLFPRILDALRPGGLLLYETFTVDQAQRGRPTNPEFLLEHDELPQLVAPLEVLRQRDGDFEDRCVAAVAARKKI